MILSSLRLLALFCSVFFWACTSATDTSSATIDASINANPQRVVADGQQTSTIAVLLQGATGKPASGLTVRLVTDDGNATLTQPTSLGMDGVARGTVASTTIGSVTVRAILDGAVTPTALSSGAIVQFVAPDPTAATDSNGLISLAFTASPTTLAADGQSASTLVLRATRDGLPLQDAAFSLTGLSANDVVSPGERVLDANGAWQGRLSGTLAGTRVLIASVQQARAQLSVSFVPGAISQARSVLEASSPSAIADGNAPLTLVVRVRDAMGNALPHQAVSVSSPRSDVLLSPATGFTDDLGNFVAKATGTDVGDATFVASVGDAQLNATASFVAGPADAVASSLQVLVPMVATADGTSLVPMLLVLRDGLGHPIAGASVRVTSDVSPPIGVVYDDTATDAAGQLSFSVSSTTVGSVLIGAQTGNLTLTASPQFVAGPPSAASSSFTLDSNAIVADGIGQAQLTLRVKDAQGHPLSGVSATLSSTLGALSLSPSVLTTSADGRAQAIARGTHAGSGVVVATLAGLSLQRALTLVPGPTSRTTSQLRISPNPLVADGNQQASVTLFLLDAFGNAVAQAPVTLTALPTGASLSASNGTSDTSGLFTTSLSSSAVGAGVVTAWLADGPLQANVALIAGGPNQQTSSLSASPNANVVADLLDSSALLVSVKDALGHPVPGRFVSVTSVATGDSLSAPSGITAADGSFAGSLRSRRAGNKVVSAAVGDINLSTSLSFVAGPPSAATSRLSLTPASIVADGQSATLASVSALDALGNAAGNVCVAWSSSGATDTLSPVVNRTSGAGVATTSLSTTQAASRTLSATLTDSGNHVITLTAPFVAVAGAIDSGNSTLVVSPNVIVAGGAGATLTAVLKDRFGNAVASQAIALQTPDSGLSLGQTSGQSGPDGSFSTPVFGNVSGNKTLVATVTGGSLSTSLQIVAGAPDAAHSQLAVAPSQQVADGTSQVTATTWLRDRFDNVVASANVALASSAALSTTLLPASGTTDATGHFVSQVACSAAQAQILSATSGNVVLRAPVQFVPGPADTSMTSLSATPNHVVADGLQQSQLLLMAKDKNGNIAAGQNVSLTSSEPSDSLLAASGQTDAEGRFVALSTGTRPGIRSLTALCGAANVSTTLRFEVGPLDAATSSLLLVPPSGTVADAATAVAVRIIGKDSLGNVAAGKAGTLSASTSTSHLSQTAIVLDANGQWQGSLVSSAVGVVQVVASFGATSLSAEASFVAGPIDANRSSLLLSPSQVLDDGNQAASILVWLRDSYGNPVDNQQVSLSSNGAASFSVPSGNTGADGSFVSAATATTVGVQRVQATASGVVLSADLNFVVGAPTLQTTTLVATPNVIIADGNDASVVALHVTDSSANPIAGQAVTLSASSNATLAHLAGTTDANGTFVTTLKTTDLGQSSVTAHIADIETSVAIAAIAGAANQSLSTLRVLPSSVTANGQAQAVIIGYLVDSYLHSVGGVTGTFSASGPNTLLGRTSATTSASGIVTTSVSSTQAQTQMVSLMAGNVTLSSPVTFVPGAASAATSSFVVAPDAASVDLPTPVTVLVSVRDAFGNVLPSTPYTVSSSASDVVFGPSAQPVLSGATDANGLIVALVGATKSGSKPLLINVDGVALSSSASFVAGQPNALQSSLTGPAGAIVANGQAAATLSLAVRDQYQNPVVSDLVTLSVDGNAAFVSPSSRVTDANGELVATITGTRAGTATVRLREAQKDLAFSSGVSLVPGDPNTQRSSWVASKGSAIADGNDGIVCTLRALDAFDNVVGAAPVSVSMPGTGSLQPVAGVTDANGTFVSVATSTRAEPKSVSVAFSSGGTLSTPVQFFAGVPSSATSSLSGTPSAVTADGASSLQLTALLRDAFGNPTQSQLVSFSSSDAIDVLSSPNQPTDAGGAASCGVSSTHAGTKHLLASFAGGSVTQDFAFVSGAASSQRSSLTASPNVVVADGVSSTTLTVTVLDAFNNPVGNQSIGLSPTGTGSSLSSPMGTSDANGTFVSAFRSTTAESKSITASLGALSVSTGMTFVAGPPAVSQSSLSVNPVSVVADATSSATVVASFRDAFGNACANANVAFFGDSNTTTLFPPVAVTSAAGSAASSATSRVAQGTIVRAQVGNAIVSAALQFVAGAPEASQSRMTLSPNVLVADGVSAAVLLIVARDAQANPVANLPITLQAPAGTTLSPVSGTTGSDGRYSATATSTVAGSQSISALIGSYVTLSATASFVPGPISNATSTLVANPTSVTADGNAACTLSVLTADAFGNAVGNQNVALSVSGRNNTLGAFSGTADNRGAYQTTLRSSRAESKTVTATLGPAGQQTSIATQVIFVTGSASSQTTTLVASPNVVVADGVQPALVVLTVLDPQGNPIANQNATLSASGNNTVVSASATLTDANGQIKAAVRATRAEVKTVTAALSTYSLSTPVTFVAGSPVPANSSLSVFPGQALADGNSTVSLLATLADAFGNVAGAQNVTFWASGGNAVVQPAFATTSATGVATSSLASSVAENKTITASFGGGALVGNATFVAGAVSNTRSSFFVSPNSILADGNAVATLQVLVADVQGNPVGNQSIQLLSNRPNDKITPALVASDAFGSAQATLSSVLAGDAVLTAKAGATSLYGMLRFVHGAPSPATSSLVANPNVVAADGVSGTTLTLLLRDAQGNPADNMTVMWSASSMPNVFGATSQVTDSAGVARTSLSSTFAAQKVVTASVAGGTASDVTVIFVPGPPSVAQSQFLASPSSATADGVAAVVLSVTLRDAQANPILQSPVSLSASGVQNTFSVPSGSTDANATFASTLRSTRAQTEVITATVTGTSLVVPVGFTADSPNAQTTQLSVSPSAVVADGVTTATLRCRVADALNNPVPNQPITFAISGVAATIPAPSATSDANGMAVAAATATQAGSATVTATIGNITVQSGLTFVAGSPNASRSQLYIDPASATADGVSALAISVAVADAFGNPVGNQLVSFASSNANVVLANASATTDALGAATTTARSTRAQIASVTASAQATSLSGNLVFLAGTTSNVTSWVSANPNTAVADGNAFVQLSLLARDAQGNCAPGRSVTFLAGGQNNVLSPSNVATTDANGFAFSRLFSTRAEPKATVVTVDGTSFSVTPAFVAGPVSATTSALSVTPNAVVAGTAATFTFVALDAFRNAVANQNVSFFVTSGGNAVALGIAPTDAAGRASISAFPTTAGAWATSATIQNVTLPYNAIVTPASPNASQSSLALSSNTAVADNVASIFYTVSLRDAYGNAAPNQSIVVTSSNSNDQLSAASGTSDANGQLTGSWRSTRAQGKALSATAGAATFSSAMATFVNGSPNATASQMIINPNASIVANGNAIAAITASFFDAFGNAVPNQTVTFSALGQNVVLSATSQLSDTNGRVTSNLSSTRAEVKSVTATMSGAALSANASFVAGPANASASSIALSTNSVVAGGNVVVTVVFADAFGNPDVGASPVLTATGTSNTSVALLAPLDASGQGNFVFSSTKAQNKQLTATLNAAALSANVTVFAGSANAAASSLTASPNVGVIANRSASTNLAVTVRDPYGNPISGVGVSVSSTGSNNQLTNPNGVSQADGSFYSTLSSSTAETKIISANFGVSPLTTPVVFVAGSPNRLQSSLTASPTTGVAADANKTVVVSLRLADAYGNGVPSVPVQWRRGDQSLRFSAANATTASDGAASVLTSTRAAGLREAIAWTPNLILTTNANFTRTTPTCQKALLLPSPPSVSNLLQTYVRPIDFNGDGNVDIAFISNDSPPFLRWMIGSGNAVFGPIQQTSVTACTGPTSLIAADFTGDQVPDILFSGFNTNNICVVPGNANGTFRAAVAYATDSSPVSAAVGDFNQDGNADIAVGTASGFLNIFLQTSGGSFSAKKSFAVGGAIVHVAAGDLNLDGYTDIVLSTSSPNAIVTYLGSSGGNMTLAQTVPMSSAQNELLVTDLSGDGWPDVVSSSTYTNVVSVFLNQQNANIALKSTFSFAGLFNSGITGALDAFDIDGDNKTDVVAVVNYNYFAPLMNTGGGNLQLAPSRWLGQHLEHAAIRHADVNRDGKMDIISPSRTVHIVLGNGTSSFVTPTTYLLTSSASDVVSGDFDGDGLIDILILNDGLDLQFRKGSGDGLFDVARTAALSLEPQTYLSYPRIKDNLTATDVDRDGALDVPMANLLGVMGVLWNDQNATFSTNSMVSLTPNTRTQAVAAIDINGDGNTDLVGTNGNSIWLALGLGGRAFSAATAYPCGTATGGLDVADLDGDGMIDVLAVSQPDANVCLLKWSAGSVFSSVVFAAPQNANLIRLRDLNADGNVDMLLWGQNAQTTLRLGSGGGAFGAPSSILDASPLNVPQVIKVEDLNGDGIPDLLRSYYGDVEVGFFQGKGDGTFQPGVFYASQFTTSGITVGDFNRDGLPDYVSVARNPISMNVHLQGACMP